MKAMHSHVVRSLVFALLCSVPCLVPVNNARAASGSPFTLVGGRTNLLTPSALTADLKTQTKGHLSSDGKTLTFAQKIIRLVVVTGPEDDMLSYRIGGLRNPTLSVPQGASIKMLFVNTDDDMSHNIRFGLLRKTYPNVMTAYVPSSVGTPDLPHKSDTALHGEELILRVPSVPGAYAYLCTVRGHAQGGMVGKVVVR